MTSAGKARHPDKAPEDLGSMGYAGEEALFISRQIVEEAAILELVSKVDPDQPPSCSAPATSLAAPLAPAVIVGWLVGWLVEVCEFLELEMMITGDRSCKHWGFGQQKRD